jgi:hypothetical protein
MKVMSKKEMRQAWVALLFTTGEFVAGVFLLVDHGHVLALYLACTYAARETSGGRHYHDIVVDLMRGSTIYFRKRSIFDGTPSVSSKGPCQTEGPERPGDGPAY